MPDRSPITIAINAWTGSAPAKPSSLSSTQYAKSRFSTAPQYAAAMPPEVSESAWQHEKIGWGLVLPENEALAPNVKARAEDAPDAIQRLLQHRAGGVHKPYPPVFRYSATWQHRFSRIHRYLEDGRVVEVAFAGSAPGIGEACMPRYLLLYGTPQELPWDLQFHLQGSAFVGRIDLDGDGLANYIEALINGFGDASVDRPVVWSADHENGDITELMRRAIAEPIFRRLKANVTLAPTHLSRRTATVGKLLDALASAKPALVITTSHGLTSPLDDSAALAASVGVPVDSDAAALSVDALMSAWSPNGAIWYAHACCSGGTDKTTGFAGLVAEDSDVDLVLRAIASSGSRVAPLPRALLGAPKPLRAFVGHVEPTFDWTLRSNATGQILRTRSSMRCTRNCTASNRWRVPLRSTIALPRA
ncbi:MAG: hypothetical protein ACHREM_09545 [Polyangiales bacterium]